MEGIPLTPEDVERFRSDVQNNSTDPTKDAENIEWVQRLAEKGLELADHFLAKRDERLKTDETTKKLYSELSAIVAVDEFSIEDIKKSPKYFWGLITGGIIIDKLLVLKIISDEKKQLADKQEPQPESSGADE